MVKNGDFVVLKGGKIAIVNRVSGDYLYTHAVYYPSKYVLYNELEYTDDIIDLASEKQKNSFIRKFKKDFKVWNDVDKIIEEMIGDDKLYLFWDYDIRNAVIGFLTYVDTDFEKRSYFCNDGTSYDHIMEFKNKQQFKELIQLKKYSKAYDGILYVKKSIGQISLENADSELKRLTENSTGRWFKDFTPKAKFKDGRIIELSKGYCWIIKESDEFFV